MLKNKFCQLGLGLCTLTSAALSFGFSELPSQAMPASQSNSFTIALASPCPSLYPSQLIHAITKSFNIYICGGNIPNQYIGIFKTGGESVTLPVTQQSHENIFIAVLGQDRYILTPKSLTVSRRGRTILVQPAVLKRFG